MSRIKNTFSYYVLKEKPQFYYLDVEKNGQDMRIYRNDVLEITYRDEFVVKAVASDDLSGKYTYVRFEGLSSRSSDLGVLMKGIDFVNKLIRTGGMSGRSGTVNNYQILVHYLNDTIASVPLKIVITPQDWFRFAKESSNVEQQIDYLKKAIELNQNDVRVRKILAGIYAHHGRTDDAKKLYQQVLTIQSDDTTAMLELVKIHIKQKEFGVAAKLAGDLIKINPKETEGHLALGLALEEKSMVQSGATLPGSRPAGTA